MAVDMDKLNQVILKLTDAEKQTVYEFASYLASKKNNTFDIDAYLESLPEDDETLSEEELRQLSSKEGFMTREEAKRAYNLDLP